MSKKTEGFRIDHNYDELEAGNNYIMVAKDTPLLDHEKGTVIDQATELENIELQASYKQKIKLKEKEDFKRGTTYDPYKNAIEDKESGLYEQNDYKKEGIDLDEVGQYDPNKVAQLAAIKQKLSKKKGNEISLETQKIFTSEYEVPEAPKKDKLKNTMAHKRRKPEADSNIEEYLDKNQENISEKEQKVNKEEIRKNAEINEINTQIQQSNKYEKAVKRAKKMVADIKNEQDEYDEIEAAINRQRQVLNKSENSKRGENFVLESLEKEEQKQEPENSKNTDKKEPEDENMVLMTDAMNFINSVDSIKARKEYKRDIEQNTNLSLKDTRDGRASVVNVPLPTERLKFLAPGYSSCVPQNFAQPNTHQVTPPKPVEPESKPEIKDQPAKNEKFAEPTPITPAAQLDEVLVGKGVGNAIKILRERKLLGHTLYAGRAKDATKEEEFEKYNKLGMKGGEKIDFDYRNEKGEKMTIKEAWRYQCRIFHGLKQSKKKREKIILKKQKEKEKLSMDPNKTKLSQALKKTQQEKGTAFMILDAKKPVIF